MFTIELTLKGNPLSLSVERKEKEASEELYKSIVDTIQQGDAKLLELTCEKQQGRKISVLTSEISAVQVLEKNASATVTGVGFARS
jgi:hypothetical protein